MKRMTSIKLPVSAAAERDKEGFIKENIRWQEAIPATAREATRREQVQASQAGYNISLVFETRFYEGQSILVDESDGQEYDIQQATISSGGVSLDCTRRQSGRGFKNGL